MCSCRYFCLQPAAVKALSKAAKTTLSLFDDDDDDDLFGPAGRPARSSASQQAKSVAAGDVVTKVIFVSLGLCVFWSGAQEMALRYTCRFDIDFADKQVPRGQ